MRVRATLALGIGSITLAAIMLFCAGVLHAQMPAPVPPDTNLKVLIVIAHPDDESGFSATVYKITHDLGGSVDLALITNGEGGYKYSTLAEQYYNLELTDEKVGRENLPWIRKRELMSAGRIIGIRNFFFLDQLDHRYTQNVDSVLQYVWDIPQIRKRLAEIVAKGNYNYIFCLLPTPDTHGHHKGATIMALETAKAIPLERRPVVLGGSVSSQKDTAQLHFTGLSNYPITSVSSGSRAFTFDRTTKFGWKNALDYRIIVNWEIAEHKSQGTMQMLMNLGDYENFWWFDINNPARMDATRQLFEKLKVIRYVPKTYN
ncbi:MAG: PIG-L family deacetylase [Bacteroidetes bacterium]|nr:PIG-L family deacetylase [Bacteroidota bacterium]